MAEGRFFNVVAEDVCVKYEEKKSKFLGYSHFVRTEEQVNEFLSLVRSEHSQATHICYAFTLGQNGEISRSNDNGEPSGTAGQPILEAIKKKGLTNTLMVVVRYFGGKELGTSGLYRAYQKTAIDTLERASYFQMVECIVYQFTFDYNAFARAGAYFRDNELPIVKIDYLDSVKAEVAIPISKEQRAFSDLKMMFEGNVHSIKLRSAFFRFNPPKK